MKNEASIDLVDIDEAEKLKNTVLENGFCIGCGNCAFYDRAQFGVEDNSYGEVVAVSVGQGKSEKKNHLKICPFSGESITETEISRKQFPSGRASQYLGNYIETYAGHVASEGYRENGTSGGTAKWIGAKLLERNLVDFHIQVTANETSSELYRYEVFDNKDAALTGSKAAYYPVSLVEMYQFITSNDARFSITAIPCFTKSIRLMQEEDSRLAVRVKFIIGIICGGMKSKNYTNFIIDQYGLDPADVVNIDYRVKDQATNARQQASRIKYIQKDSGKASFIWKRNAELVGLDYGMGLFKPRACDYCDDIVAETADISVGDAWLPEFVKDPRGDSVVIVRSQEIMEIFSAAQNSGEVNFHKISENDVVASQAAGFRHRRDGLLIRMNNRQLNGLWVPIKRRFDNGSSKINAKRKRLYLRREEISELSRKKYVILSKKAFIFWVNDITKDYKLMKAPSFFEKVLKKLSNGRYKTDV